MEVCFKVKHRPQVGAGVRNDKGELVGKIIAVTDDTEGPYFACRAQMEDAAAEAILAGTKHLGATMAVGEKLKSNRAQRRATRNTRRK